MKKLLMLLVVVGLAASSFAADDDDNKAAGRVKSASTILEEIQNAPDTGIPDEVMGSAECVAVVPSMLKAGFVFGAQYGRGVASCRTAKGWSDPAFITIVGGSFGFQIGGEATDFVLLIMNERGASGILTSKVKLGADASVAAGPVGRDLSAETDATLRADILSYSRARGAFAGIALEGSTIRPDGGANEQIYGQRIPAKQIVRSGRVAIPAAAQRLVSTLDARTPNHKS